ncbi:MAG: acyl carrier protein [Burkholderiales bacterium]|nr:acyl carrier protein [Burkholderiales bacterium]
MKNDTLAMSLFAQLQIIIATTLKVPTSAITPDTRDEDLSSWDSLGQVNLIMALEQSFDLEVDVEEFASLNSVPAILDFLARQGVS